MKNPNCFIALFAGSVATLAGAASAQSFVPTTWNFSEPTSPLTADSGPGVLIPRGTTASVIQAGTASSFGLPLLPNGAGGFADSGVILVPQLAAAQGLGLSHNRPANGTTIGNGWLGSYTIIMDVLIPASSFGSRRAIFNTNETNANNSDLFIYENGRPGTDGNPVGQMQPNTWHRIAFAVGAADAEGKGEVYIDGNIVAGYGSTGSDILSGGRFGLYCFAGNVVDAIFFGDDNSETAPIYVSSIQFIDRRLIQEDLAKLGGPTAGGITVPGTRASQPIGALPRVGIIAHRGDSGNAPENTLASVKRAIRQGVEAIEMDIRLSSDGQVVLMHDTTVDRTTTCTGNATAFTAAQLAGCDNGSWFDIERYGSERVERLADVLRYFKGSGVTPYLDIKVNGMADEIKLALEEAGMTAQDVWMWAYSRTGVSEYNAVFTNPPPRIVVGERPTTPAQFAELRALNVIGLDLGLSGATPGYGDLVRSEGLFLSVYTINRPSQMTQAITNGVSKMETDYPELLDSIMQPLLPGDIGSQGGAIGPDGLLDNNDFIVFINWFFDGVIRADIGKEGGAEGSDDLFDNNDFIVFINRFFGA
jgi:glycerophosphoryl diester phosphodiesterase